MFETCNLFLNYCLDDSEGCLAYKSPALS